MSDPRLAALLDRWHALHQQGRHVTPEELCADCPELLDALRQSLAASWATQAPSGSAPAFDPASTVEPHAKGTGAPGDALPPLALTLEEFMERLGDSGLVPPAELQTLLDTLPPEERPADASALATELVRRQKITAFQVRALHEGNARQLVLGEYTILDRIGAGGMGQVFRARHRKMDRQVAVKLLPKEAVASPELVQRFQREVQAAAKLVHPNIVTAFDASEQDGHHFLVMEFVQGSDLFHQIRKQGPLPVEQAVRCVVQAARGLEYAHSQGVIHRDIKPANLLLDAGGTVKILDMGLARFASNAPEADAHLTQVGAVMGTPDYLPPEQGLDAATADHRADVYSLGCTLWYLLTGKPMYEGDNIMKKIIAHREAPIPSLRQARPEVSARLDAIFQMMVAKKPEERYESMTAVLGDLTQETGPLPRKPAAKRGKLAAAGVLLVAGALAAAGVFLSPGSTVPVTVPEVATVIVEVDQPDAIVEIDGKKIPIKSPDDKGPFTVEVDEGRHELKVTKAGFEPFTRAFTAKAGDREAIKVHLEKPAPLPGPTLTGKWSAMWANSSEHGGEFTLQITEKDAGELGGLWGDYKFTGKRLRDGRVEMGYTSEDGKYTGLGRVLAGGQALRMSYVFTQGPAGKERTFRGTTVAVREGPGHAAKDAKPAGKWVGVWCDALNRGGDSVLDVKERPNSTLAAVWDKDLKTTLTREGPDSYSWQGTDLEGFFYKATGKLTNGGRVLRITYTATPPKKKKSHVGTSFLVKEE